MSECCRVSKILSFEVPIEPIILNVWMLDISIRFKKFSNWIRKRKEKKRSYGGGHLWKFNPQTVVTFLRNHGFHDVTVETIYTVIPIILFLYGLVYKRKSKSHFIDRRRRKSNFSHFASKCLRREFSWRIEAKSYEALSS